MPKKIILALITVSGLILLIVVVPMFIGQPLVMEFSPKIPNEDTVTYHKGDIVYSPSAPASNNAVLEENFHHSNLTTRVPSILM